MLNNNISKSIVVKIVIGFLLVVCGVAFRPVMYIAAIYCMMILLTEKDTNNIVYMLFAWLSISPVFKFSVGGTSIFTYLELLVIIRFVIQKMKIKAGFLICWILYLMYLIVGMGPEYKDMIKAVCVPLILYFLFRELNYISLKNTTFFYIIGILMASFVGLFRNNIPNMVTFVTYKEQRMGQSATSIVFTDRFSGLLGDPNYYTIHLIVIISIIALLFARKEISAFVFYMLYFIVIALGALTGSKSFILMLAAVTILVVFLLLKNSQYKHAFVFIIIIAIGIILLGTGYIDIFSRVMYRLQNVSNLGFDTGRGEIWKSYYDLYNGDVKLLLFGSGLGNGFLLRVPHNFYLDIIALLGIIGGCIYLLTIGTALGRRQLKGDIDCSIPGITLAVMYFFLSMYYSIDLPFQLILAAGYYYYLPTFDSKQVTNNKNMLTA